MNKDQSNLALLNIKISQNVKNKLDQRKIHPRQSYNEVIEILLDYIENQPLTTDKK